MSAGPEFVPGQFSCAKCGFTLMQATMNAGTGEIGERDAPGERCPNDGAPLWRVTWAQRCAEVEARLAVLIADPRVQAIEDELMGIAPAKRCEYCDGTGDVHRADGEWLGRCHCGAAVQQ